jgi:hypothetical protein
MNSLEFLKAVYNDPELPLHTRIKAAHACLPYEFPRLSMTAVIPATSEEFAKRLELAVTRSMLVLEARRESELKTDLRLPPIPADRRFRRF